MTTLMGVLFFAMLAAGLPIFVVLGLTATGMLVASDTPLVILVQKMLDELNSELLLALPFFGMAAVYMERGGTARALVKFAASLLGAFRGGLGLVAVAGCAMFSAIAGSSVVTALAMGALMVPLMMERGYPARLTTGLLATSSTMGILIPPSLPMILFAIVAKESVPRLFLAGVIPGLVMCALLAAYVMWAARVHKLPAEPSVRSGELLRAAVSALPALSVPILVAVGIYGGFVTLTESAILAALAAYLVGLLFYKGFTPRESVSVTFNAMKSAASIILIVAMALTFSHWITVSGFTDTVVRVVSGWNLNGIQFLLVVSALLFILGMFLEGASMLLLVLPVLLPLLGPLGIDPVHFCIVLVINIELAMITPPVGLNLFVISGVAKVPLAEVVRGSLPLVLLLLAFLVLIICVPAISLWLPNLAYGG
jgi:C4-dicarboxylate transporter DctM subunit